MATATQAPHHSGPAWFVPGDLDGCFGLFFSGLPDLLLIAGLAPLCGFPVEMVVGRILPGVALSIFAGNCFYSWQAHRLALQSGRNDITAIPFGVNTPTIFAYIFLIMLPVYQRTHDPSLTWQVGVFASFLSGAVQTVGAFCTDWLRRIVPRAALLCPLAGIAMAFLCLGFIFGIFQAPAVALLPAIILLAVYSSRLRLPLRLPGGLLCLIVAASLFAALRAFHLVNLPLAPVVGLGFHPPRAMNVAAFLRQAEGWKHLSIILPMSVLDTLVSLQILESVKLAGDDYPTRPSLMVNGLATLAAAAFGSPFPTTLYFGHSAYKALGARSGYSTMSGVVTMLLCLTGVVPLVLHIVPLEAVSIVVVWVGLVMVGQTFQDVPKRHYVAVALGLVPMLASWTLQIVDLAVRKAGSTLSATAPAFGNELAIYGLIAISQGALLVSMVWAACLAMTIERQFLKAAMWMSVGAVLACFGVIHAYTLEPQGVSNRIGLLVAPAFTWSYAAGALFLLGCHWYAKRAARPFIDGVE
jgi:AGZA family xanthine/uracil permease-like MFS transporter